MLSPSNSSFKICRSEFTKLSSSSTCSRTLLLVVALQKEVIFFFIAEKQVLYESFAYPLASILNIFKIFFYPLKRGYKTSCFKIY